MHIVIVARVRRHGELYSLWYVWVSGKKGVDEDFLFFINVKREWESPPSILVTRNLNWSQRSGTEIDCVNRRY
jgi:hypothetical protein